ncbi:MAG: phosphate regulon sensor histidine kinase PhoR [Firmicutes bacterium HGW-Firmicutes-8]|nr:MAG: phosphate regulon sensor histidine kinase PhoR [Firmicutes bacterium HGW-Firmicutes-8]
MFNSIKWRLTAIFFSVTAVFLFLMGFYLINSMEQYSFQNTQSRVLSYARLVADDLRDSFTGKPSKNYYQDYAHRAKNDINARVTVIDTSGKVLGDSTLDKDTMANHANHPEIKAAMRGGTGQSLRYSTSLRERMFYFAVPVKSDNRVLGIVRVAIPWSEIQAGQNHIRFTIGTAVVVALILMIIVVSSFTSSLVVPLQEMTQVAGEIAEGKLDRTLDVDSNDEIGALSRGLNYMAERLRDNIRQITEERNKVEAILASMNDGVIAVDCNGNILLINPAAERMFNIKYENSMGKGVIEVIRNYDLEKLLQTALMSEESITREVQIFIPDPKSFRISTAPLMSETGVVGVVAVLRDITAFREVERMKTDFVANVSHELRTPLTSIKGFVETLMDGAMEDPKTAAYFLEIINDETDRLNRLISDLLSLSKVEAKQGKIRKAALNLDKLIINTVSILSPQASEKNQILNVDIKIPLPVINADEDMIGQLLINLVDNAIKYTANGGRVDIRAERWNDSVKIAVSDTGIGIPRDSIPRLFERFYRVDKARSREMGGTGLGLAIVKHILEVHSGRIEVDSIVGQGSTFTVYLPAGNDPAF